MARFGWITLFGAAFVALTETTMGQRPANWRVYKLPDGLPESACISVSVSSQGRVVANHLSVSSVTELDGYTITVLPSPQGRGRVYESPGGQLWTVAPAGLEEFLEGVWVLHAMPEIAGRVPNSRFSDPVPLCPVRQGLVLCLLPDRLMELNSTVSDGPQTRVLRNSNQTQLESFASMTPARDGGLWIAGARGLAKLPAPLR